LGLVYKPDNTPTTREDGCPLGFAYPCNGVGNGVLEQYSLYYDNNNKLHSADRQNGEPIRISKFKLIKPGSPMLREEPDVDNTFYDTVVKKNGVYKQMLVKEPGFYELHIYISIEELKGL
jgi:hypothetical protein